MHTALVRWFRLAFAALASTWVFARFALRARLRHFRAARRGQELARLGPLEQSPARPFGPDVHELDRDWLFEPNDAAHPQAERAVVVYFAGSGETLHAPLPPLRRLLNACESMRGLRCFMVEPPHQAGAYAGAASFGTRSWDQLSTLVDAFEGPFVLVGLSRGAIAAMDAGTRIAEERGKVAACVALSPPLARPPRMPPSVELVAELEGLVWQVSQHFTGPGGKTRSATLRKIVRAVQVALTSFIHEELRMATTPQLRGAMHDLLVDDPLRTSLRSVREFRLLTRADEHALTRLCDAVACAVARSERISLHAIWGAEDTWADAGACRTRLLTALERAGVPRERYQTGVVESTGHALYREHNADLTVVAAALDGALADGLRSAEQDRARQAREHQVQMRLRSEQPGSTTLDD